MPILRELPLEEIRATADQPRKSFYAESLEDLAASIRERGVLEPIVVRPSRALDDGSRYEIVMGERRFRASKMAGRQTIPAIIKDMNDEEAAADALLENFQREDLNPIDKDRAVQGLLQFLNMEKICRTLGVSETTVRRLTDLLTLPKAIQGELVARPDAGQAPVFNEGHARALQPLNADPATPTLLIDKVKREKLSVGHLEQIVVAMLQYPAKKALFLLVVERAGHVAEVIAQSRDGVLRELGRVEIVGSAPEQLVSQPTAKLLYAVAGAIRDRADARDNVTYCTADAVAACTVGGL